MYKKDLFYTAMNQLWKVVAGPLVLLFIPLYLSPIEQGYWYTFTSIAALGVFADLGFSTIILQFAAHEFAYLDFNENREFVGDQTHLWRLSSFFRFSLKWLCRVIFVVFPLILLGGYLFLETKEEAVYWQIPWVIYAVASAGVFFYSSLLYFFEGCNSVGLVQNIRLKISIGTSTAMLLGLYFRFDLFALSLSLAVSMFVGFFLLVKTFMRPMRQLLQLSAIQCYDWWPEFSALIWRYAISWSSGFFIFQLFTPLAFKFHGAVFAGQVGISMAMWTAGFNIAMTWITAVIPRLNILVAERDWIGLDSLFGKSIWRSLCTMLVGGCMFFVLYFIFSDKVMFFQRLLSLSGLVILFLCWIFQLLINGLAVYLRAHKKEPLMMISFVSAI